MDIRPAARTFLAALSPAVALAALTLALHAQELTGDAAWNVNAPPGPSIEATVDVREGTCMNLDVSHDGHEIVVDLLGDIYLLPIEGGEAKRIASGVAW